MISRKLYYELDSWGNIIDVTFPTHKKIKSVAGVRVRIDSTKEGGVLISEITKDLEERNLLRFVKGELPEILEEDYSEIIDKLIDSGQDFSGSMDKLILFGQGLEFLSSEGILNVIRTLFLEEEIILEAWNPRQSPSIDKALIQKYNPGLWEEDIRGLIKHILKDMTGDDYSFSPVNNVHVDTEYMEIRTFNDINLSLDAHGSGVQSVIRHIPGILRTIKRGGICFIGGENDEVTGSWHRLIKNRFPEYLNVFLKHYSSEYIQVFKHEYDLLISGVASITEEF